MTQTYVISKFMAYIYKNYGKVIKTIRCMRDLSQLELSTQTQLDSSYISRIEAGERVPSARRLELIAKALDVPMSLIIMMATQGNNSERKKSDFDEIGKLLLGILYETTKNR